MSDTENEDNDDELTDVSEDEANEVNDDANLAGDASSSGPPQVENKDSLLDLQEANNISKAAYMEIMTKALGANTWIKAIPPLGSLEYHLIWLRAEPLKGLTVECSIESATVPVDPQILISMMMDVEKWASFFCHIVHSGSSSIPTGVLGQLNAKDHRILDAQMVNAEFHLPTPFVKNWRSRFLRCQRQIMPDVWAIVDLSYDYLPHMPSDSDFLPTCWKKPSGVIIRKHHDGSEVIWIENMEVSDDKMQYYIYSGIMNSDFAFSARRWVSTMLWKLKRDESRLFQAKIQVHEQADTCLLELTESMKMAYLGCVNATPDKSKWVTLHNQEIRLLKNVTEDHGDMQGSNIYIALTSFRVNAESDSVFHFLVKKNLEILWRNSPHPEVHEELINLSTFGGINSITVHRKVTVRNDSTQVCEHLLQETSTDDFCSFILAAPMTEQEFTDALFSGNWTDISLQPSGFAIISDGHIRSNATLVTIAVQQEVDNTEIGQVIKSMSDLIDSVEKEINQTLTGRGKE